MTCEVQITRWRDLPSMVAARAGDQQVKTMLPERFQEAIDEAAMRLGESSADDYLAGWNRSPWQPYDADPDSALTAVAGALEAEWDEPAVSAYLDALG